MSAIKRFEDIAIWKQARDLTVMIYAEFTNSKEYGFKDQIQRASISIMNNIAEGYNRQSDKEFVKFLYYSKASSSEVRSMLQLAVDLNYLGKEKAKILISKTEMLAAGITNLIKYLNKVE